LKNSRWHLHRRLATWFAAAVLVSLTTAAVTVIPASAVPSAQPTHVSVHIGSAVGKGAIGCGDPIFGPFYSSGKIEVKASTNCSATVASIFIAVTLSRNGRAVANKDCSNYGKKSLSCTVSYTCPKRSDYYYQGASTTAVILPPGYNPPTLSGANVTPGTYDQC